MAHSAVDRLELVLVRQLGPVQVDVAGHAVQRGVHGSPEPLHVDVHGGLGSATAPLQVRIRVARHALVVVLGRGRPGQQSHREDGNPPEPPSRRRERVRRAVHRIRSESKRCATVGTGDETIATVTVP